MGGPSSQGISGVLSIPVSCVSGQTHLLSSLPLGGLAGEGDLQRAGTGCQRSGSSMSRAPGGKLCQTPSTSSTPLSSAAWASVCALTSGGWLHARHVFPACPTLSPATLLLSLMGWGISPCDWTAANLDH